jgi:ABC-2 type transport system permease protein
MEVINQVTMLSFLLAGAALIREREHGTIEHLLAMPVTPGEIMLSKIWSTGVAVLAAVLSLTVVVQGALRVPVQRSAALFFACTLLHLFAMMSMGILVATAARNMPQFGLLMVLIMLPLRLLSGSVTPRESMPRVVQDLMQVAPTTHFGIRRPGDSVPRRWFWRSLAAIPGVVCHRFGPFRDFAGQVPRNDRPDGLKRRLDVKK